MSEFRPSCVLVTGGAGFIGSNFIRWVLAHDRDICIVNYDALTYAGNLKNLEDVGGPRYAFVHANVRDFAAVARALSGAGGGGGGFPAPDAVLHCAAESHVDRSILGPAPFVDTNVTGTFTLLEACRAAWGKNPANRRFLHVSTDEVYGNLAPGDPPFTEASPLTANSPYAATKAAADLLVRAWVHTFQFPATLARCSNNYGPYQFPEKFIPVMITRALAGRSLPVYGDGGQVRDWLHVTDHAAALWAILCRGRVGEVYNVSARAERKNIDIARRVLEALGKPESLIEHVPDRPGHDRRYALDPTKLERELGWKPGYAFDPGLTETVEWYLAHRDWWERSPG